MSELSPQEAQLIDGDGIDVPAIPWHARLRGKVNPRYVYALLDQAIFSLGNLIVYATVKRHTSLAEYGIFYLALRSLDVLNQLCNVLIWGPLTFNLSIIKSDDRYAKYLGSNLAHQLIASSFGVLLFFVLAAVSLRHGHASYHRLFLPLALPSIAILFREFLRRIYFAQMRFALALILDSVTVLCQVLGVFLLVHLHAVSYEHVLWVLALGCIAVVVYGLFTERRHLRFSLPDIRADFILNLELGRWFFGSNMLFLASSQANPWILNSALGADSVANYAICEQVINFPRVALTSMQNAMAPSMALAVANGGKSALRKVVRRMDILLISGTTLMTAAIIAFGPWVQRVIFHASAPHARLVLGILAVNLLAFAAALAQSYGLTALNKPSRNFYAGAIGLVAQLAVAFVIVRPFGVSGVAVSLLLGNLVVLAARIFYYMREMRRP